MRPLGSLNGPRLQQARERAGLSIRQAKTALGIASHYLEGMEDGSIDLPFEDIVCDAAELYAVDPAWLWLGLSRP